MGGCIRTAHKTMGGFAGVSAWALYTVGMQPNSETPTDTDLKSLPEVCPGLYRHYKGGEYNVLEVVRHSETLEAMVLYQALYGQRGLWVRPADMFVETVVVDGVVRARFEYVQALGLDAEVKVVNVG